MLHGGRRSDFVVSMTTVVDSIVADVIVIRRRTSTFRCETEVLERFGIGRSMLGSYMFLLQLSSFASATFIYMYDVLCASNKCFFNTYSRPSR